MNPDEDDHARMSLYSNDFYPPGSPSRPYDIDANDFDHDDRQKRICVLGLLRGSFGPLFDETRRVEGLALSQIIEAVIEDSAVQTPPYPTLGAIDEHQIDVTIKDYDSHMEDTELRLITDLVYDNVHKASQAVSHSIASQFGVASTHDGLVMHLNPSKVRGHILRYLHGQLLKSNGEDIWLCQLNIEYDVLSEALESYSMELGVNPSVQLVVRLPRLGVIFAADSAIASRKQQPFRIVVVDWISLPGGSRWLGLNVSPDDKALPSVTVRSESSEDPTHGASTPDHKDGRGPQEGKIANGFREPRLPREMLDKCIEPNKRCYLHVFLKSDGKLRNFPYFDKAPRCRCAIGPGESVKHCGIEHEYRTGHMVTQKPLWSLSQVHRDETIEKATPKPIDPKRPEYIFEMLNNSNCSEVEDMNQDNLLAVAKEALRNVSHLILIDGEEDLPIGCEVCFQRAIWETGAFAFGRRDRLPREAMVDEYDEHDPTRHVRGRRGGQRFIVNEAALDWVSILKRVTIVITPRLKKAYERAKVAESVPRSLPLPRRRTPHLDEDITDFITGARDTFDPSHFDDKIGAHPMQHCIHLGFDNVPRLNPSDVSMFEEEQAVFLMQGKRPLGSSRLSGTETETKSHLPARPGLFYNSMFPLEGPIRVDRPENGYRTIVVDVNLQILFANCEVAFELLTRLSSQPWCSINDKESRLLRALIGTETPAVDFSRSLRFLRTDPQTSIAVFYDVARKAPRTDTMPSFLSIAALARYAVVADESKRKENIRKFLDAFIENDDASRICFDDLNDRHDISRDFPDEPQFLESDYVVDSQDCAKEDVKIHRLVVDSEVGKRMYPLHREAVLEKLDRRRWLAWGKQDHLVFHDKPRKLAEDNEETWNGHVHRAEYGFMVGSFEHHVPLLYWDREEMFESYCQKLKFLRAAHNAEYDFGHAHGGYTRNLHDEEAGTVFRYSGVDKEVSA